MEILSFEPANELDPGIQVHRIGNQLPLRMHYFCYGAAVRRFVRQFRPDILHAHYASGYATLGRLARFHPYVVSVWGSDIFDFAQRSKVHGEIISANLNSADQVCSTSHVLAQEARNFCQREVAWTPFGVDCERFQPRAHRSENGAEFVVGIVKALEPTYGVEYLVRGYADFTKKVSTRRDRRLVIVGSGSLLASLQLLAKNLGVGAQTTFLGSVPHERVPEILNGFSVFVAPSSQFEAFGVAVVEASACGLPVVVSKVGGLPEVVKDRKTGILVPPRDPGAIAKALEELFENDCLGREFGKNGRRFVLENYEWTENAGRMERLYESILNQPRFPMSIQ